jgi:hypothetical protein
MLQLRVGALDALRDEWGDEAVDLFQKVLGDCNAPLTHNGDVIINSSVTVNNCDELAFYACGSVTFNGVLVGTGGTDGNLQYAVAAGSWVNRPGNDSYVDCLKANDRNGTLAGGTVRVFLPRAGATDPNVHSGDVLAYAIDGSGNAICITDVNDDPLGTVKGMRSADVPRGWTMVAEGRGIVGHDPEDEDEFFDEIHKQGGHFTEPEHEEVETDPGGAGTTSESGVTLSAGLGGSTTFNASGETTETSVTGTVGSADPELEITGLEGTLLTNTSVTSLTIDDHEDHFHSLTWSSYSIRTTGIGAYVVSGSQTSGVRRGTSADVLRHTGGDGGTNDPAHRHFISSEDLAAAFTVEPHEHEFTPYEGDDPHKHTYTAVGFFLHPHTHGMTAESHAHDTYDHTHKFTPRAHLPYDNLQPFMVLNWIRRTH